MATWVRAGGRKMNLDQACWIDRTEDGEVHVVFDGSLTHTFRGPAADAVWKRVAAKEIDPVDGKVAGASTKTPRARRAK